MKKLSFFKKVILLYFLFILTSFTSVSLSRKITGPNENTKTENEIYHSEGRVIADTTCVVTPYTCPSGYYWDSNICGCTYYTTCQPPTSGCPSGTYWDTTNCYCATTTTTCYEPTGGCGINYYWDTPTCTCQAINITSTCSPPTNGCSSYYYWDSASCMCKPSTSTCYPPTSGCPANYYWSHGTCSCMINSTTTTTSCTPPSASCGTNYYWDTNTCTCKSSTTTCIAPSSGCPINYYWDYNSCSCQSSYTITTSCTPPNAGCEINDYWDSTNCTCKPSSTTITSCPTSVTSCASGYYWDSYSCLCKQYYQTTCTAPTTGCGEGKYWDSYSCNCVSSTYSYCTAPASGCGTNYYWDSSTCICKYNQTTSICTYPTNGCGTNYYWDSTTCSCKPYESCSVGGTGCYPPSLGCGINNYWDYYSCSCKYTSYTQATTTCAPPSSGCGIGYSWDYPSCSCLYSQTSLDRFAYESTERIDCIKSKLTDYEYQRLRFFMPVSQTGYDEIQTLSEKVKVCWETQPSTAVTGIPIQESVFKKEACLIKSIGESAYREIYEGRRIPTQNEHLWFEKCYGQVQKDSVNLLSNDEKIASETESCLKRTLGDALFKKVKSGQTEVPYNLKKSVDICFGIDPQPFEQGTTYKIPETVKECLYNSVGEVRLNEIISGTTQASLEELEKTESCFAKLNEVQKKFLPPPPEQIPFLDENDSVLLIQAKQEKKTVKQEIYGGKLTLSGKATPNTIVSIYIYSDPIVVTTKTDENGDWVYEMQKPLEEGKHVAYALVKSEKSGFIRSSVLNFQVLAAEKEPTPQVFMEEEKGTEVQKKFIYYSIGAVLIVSLVVVAGIYYLQTKRKMKEIDGLTSQGDGKTKPGTGPVD